MLNECTICGARNWFLYTPTKAGMKGSRDWPVLDLRSTLSRQTYPFFDQPDSNKLAKNYRRATKTYRTTFKTLHRKKPRSSSSLDCSVDFSPGTLLHIANSFMSNHLRSTYVPPVRGVK